MFITTALPVNSQKAFHKSLAATLEALATVYRMNGQGITIVMSDDEQPDEMEQIARKPRAKKMPKLPPPVGDEAEEG